MDAILNLDGSILLWIQDHLRADFITPAVKVITHLGDKGIFWIALALVLIAFRRTRRIGLTCALAMLFGLMLTNLLIKPLVARVRPYEVVEGLTRIIEAQRETSFPSGHTTCGLACAWVIFRMAPKKYGVPTLALAILIALSRMYVGVHYPTDILGGAVIGLSCAALALRLMPRAEKKWPRLRNMF